jgi:hypothetical protein
MLQQIFKWVITGTTTYNGNISVVNSGGASGVSFNVNASGSSTMAATKAISIGAGGFSSGTLNIPRFTQLGSAPTTLNLTGTSTTLRVGPLTTFGGNTDLRSAQLFLDGIDVGGTAYLEKTDAGNNTGLETIHLAAQQLLLIVERDTYEQMAIIRSMEQLL